MELGSHVQLLKLLIVEVTTRVKMLGLLGTQSLDTDLGKKPTNFGQQITGGKTKERERIFHLPRFFSLVDDVYILILVFLGPYMSPQVSVFGTFFTLSLQPLVEL